MATVQLIDGRLIERVQLVDVKHGEEGSRSATALIDGKEYHVYNSVVDGFNPIWNEQISFETYQLLKGTINHGFVEGSAAGSGKAEE